MLLSSIPNFFGFGLSESSTEVSLVSVACARYRRDRAHSPRSPVRYQSPQICNAENPVCGRVSTGPSVPVVDVRPCFIYSRVSDALELTGTSCIACLSLSTSRHDCDNYYRGSVPTDGRQCAKIPHAYVLPRWTHDKFPETSFTAVLGPA